MVADRSIKVALASCRRESTLGYRNVGRMPALRRNLKFARLSYPVNNFMILNLIQNKTILTIALAVLGLIAGTAVNYAIYQWKWFTQSPVSPWQFSLRRRHQASATRDKKLSPRKFVDFIPVIGWLTMRRDSDPLGTGFWLRPLLIEIACAVWLPLFYWWQTGAGLLGPGFGPSSMTTELWFWGHSLLIVLMIIATFIDFDEKSIPDAVTISGTLIALAIAAIAPGFRLPEAGAAPLCQSISFCSPGPVPAANWYIGWLGLVVALAIVTVWCIALMPFLFLGGKNFFDSIRLTIVSVIRPPRKTRCSIRLLRRGPRRLTRVLIGVWILLCIAITGAWYMFTKAPPPAVVSMIHHWHSLFGALVGLGVGGGLVWSIRIVAGHMLGKEAMGFGDVTLMAMIGAFLGWQASVLTFVFAPFGGMLIALFQLIIIRRNELAFGPYLCGAALIVLIGWQWVWPWAAGSFFWIGGLHLALLLLGSLVAMAVMLYGLQLIKQAFGLDRYEDAEEN